MKTKTEFIGLKVSKEEKERIRKEAKSVGFGVSRWIRFLVFENRITTSTKSARRTA